MAPEPSARASAPVSLSSPDSNFPPLSVSPLRCPRRPLSRFLVARAPPGIPGSQMPVGSRGLSEAPSLAVSGPLDGFDHFEVDDSKLHGGPLVCSSPSNHSAHDLDGLTDDKIANNSFQMGSSHNIDIEVTVGIPLGLSGSQMDHQLPHSSSRCHLAKQPRPSGSAQRAHKLPPSHGVPPKAPSPLKEPPKPPEDIRTIIVQADPDPSCLDCSVTGANANGWLLSSNCPADNRLSPCLVNFDIRIVPRGNLAPQLPSGSVDPPSGDHLIEHQVPHPPASGCSPPSHAAVSQQEDTSRPSEERLSCISSDVGSSSITTQFAQAECIVHVKYDSVMLASLIPHQQCCCLCRLAATTLLLAEWWCAAVSLDWFSFRGADVVPCCGWKMCRP
ncbi:hypothetical protein Nepgr_032133 [Nepenthes gracilis]|uniref:Uncharacterized protein n=1 Tax=Nepenthes gracilis TaxID=150966 RepID=A0AAD3TI23_NEPGR|nr:hypothetical protein Nepgr_032133 [Nepenthes gracilis]